MGNKEIIRRLVPCSLFETEKLENWLKDMANTGLILKSDGFHVTFATFKKSEPQQMEYRIWPENGINDYDNARHHRESYGWEYVSRASKFEIYRSSSPVAKAVDSDEKSETYLKKAVKKKGVFALINGFFNFAIFAVIGILIPIFIVSVQDGVFRSFCMASVFLCGSITSFAEAIKYKKLGANCTKQNADWETGALKHKTLNILKLVILIILFVILIVFKFDNPIEKHISSHESDPPFATITDIAHDAEYTLNNSSYFNTYTQWKTLAAPENYEWKESAKLKFADGTENSIRLFVDYHETVNPILAKAVAIEYLWEDKLSSYGYDYEKDLPDLDVDYGILYINQTGDYAVILQKGTKVIKTHFYALDGYSDELLYQWLETAASYL